MHVYPPSRRLRVHQIKEPSRVGRGDLLLPPMQAQVPLRSAPLLFLPVGSCTQVLSNRKSHPCPSFASVETPGNAAIGFDSSSHACFLRKEKEYNQVKKKIEENQAA